MYTKIWIFARMDREVLTCGVQFGNFLLDVNFGEFICDFAFPEQLDHEIQCNSSLSKRTTPTSRR